MSRWQSMARGQCLRQHRAGVRVDRNIDHSSNGKYALTGHQRHFRTSHGEQLIGAVLGYGLAPVQPQTRILLPQLPVEPNPPLPRGVSSRDATSDMCPRTTGAITNWAMRMPRAMVTGSLPRFTSSTWISPR